MRFRSFLAPTVIAVVLSAATASIWAQEDEPAKPARVTGVVVDQNDEPVAGVTVRARDWNFDAHTQTDAEGQFEFDVPPAQRSRLMFMATDDDENLVAFHQPAPSSESQPPTEPVRLVLEPARAVELIAVDADGAAVSEALAVVSSNYFPIASAETDAAGKAVLRVPREATLMHVYVMKPDVGFDYFLYRRPDAPATDPYQLPPDHAEPLRFTLNGTVTAKVRVVDKNGQPLAGVTVYPWLFDKPKKGNDINLSGDKRMKLTTGEDGMAVFRFFPADCTRRVTIWTHLDGYIATERTHFDPQKPDEPLVATLLPLVRVAGRVLQADGSPAVGVEVMVNGDGYGVDNFRETVGTNAEGKFEARVYPDMYYQFVAGNQLWVSPAVNCVVLGQSPEEVELVLQPAVRVFGQVTAGADHTPQADQYVSLYQEENVSYYDLPAGQKIPNPTGSRLAVAPRTVWSMQTVADGRFEFFVGPGKFYIFGPRNIDAVHFEITDQREHEVELHAPAPQYVMTTGHVVLAEDESVGVAEAKIHGAPLESVLNSFNAIADAEGRFEIQRSGAAMLVHASKREAELGGIVRVGAEDAQITIPMVTTATARGWLMDAVSGQPLSGKHVTYGMRIEFGNGESTTRFGGSTETADQGRFELDGLIPDQEYRVSVVTQVDQQGSPRSWRQVGTVTAEKPGLFDAGQFELKPLYEPPQLAERIAKIFAGEIPLEERLKAIQRDARLGYQHVLMVITSPAGDVCQQFFRRYYASDDDLFRSALVNYALLGVDADREEANDLDPTSPTFGLPWPQDGEMVFVVLDADGGLIDHTSATNLWPDGRVNTDVMTEFLTKNAPEMPDAQQLLDDAVKTAEREEKRLLVQFSGPRCHPCVLLSRYLDEHAELIGRDYVVVKLDPRFAHGNELFARTKPTASGIPWTMICDTQFKPLATSDGPDGNIGFPSSATGIAHFEQMLRTTAQRLTDDDIRRLIAALERNGP